MVARFGFVKRLVLTNLKIEAKQGEGDAEVPTLRLGLEQMD